MFMAMFADHVYASQSCFPQPLHPWTTCIQLYPHYTTSLLQAQKTLRTENEKLKEMLQSGKIELPTGDDDDDDDDMTDAGIF